MPDLKELVIEKLKEQQTSLETITLCEAIFTWYDEGGPDSVRSNIDKQVKELKLKFSKEAKEITGLTPKLKKKLKRK